MATHLVGLLPLMSQVETQTRYGHVTIYFSLNSLACLLQVSALIVENAYSSIPSLVRKWPMGRFLSLLCTQKWYSAPKIAGIPSSLPILMLSGLRDRYIPPSEMVELWEAAKRRPKKNTGWFGFAFGRNDDDESLIQPENDVFKTFDYGDHCVYHLSALPFS